MRSKFTKAAVMLVAVFALGAVVSSAAWAGEEIPEFKAAKAFTYECKEATGGLGKYATKAECESHTGKQSSTGKWQRFFNVTFTSTSGVSTLYAGGIAIICDKAKDKGGLSSATTVGNVVFTFEECYTENTQKEQCKVNGGTIVTNALTGKLGEIADPKTVGIAISPEETGKSIVTLTGTCTPEAAVKGILICEVTPINVSQTTGEIVCAVTGTPRHQLFEEIEFESGEALPHKGHLEFFGNKAAEETTVKLTFSEKVEVNFTDSDEG